MVATLLANDETCTNHVPTLFLSCCWVAYRTCHRIAYWTAHWTVRRAALRDFLWDTRGAVLWTTHWTVYRTARKTIPEKALGRNTPCRISQVVMEALLAMAVLG